MSYAGPVLGVPLPIELHNTLYAVRGQVVDGLAGASGLRGWLAALADRLPIAAGRVDAARLGDFVSLRDAVREALRVARAGGPVPDDVADELNRVSASSPRSIQLTRRGSAIRHHGETPTDVILGIIAADTIALVTRPDDLRDCGAPGCVLMFVKDHPRREWCSPQCGNRARQARHYAKARSR